MKARGSWGEDGGCEARQGFLEQQRFEQRLERRNHLDWGRISGCCLHFWSLFPVQVPLMRTWERSSKLLGPSTLELAFPWVAVDASADHE